jgi:hypothetical protein
MIPHTHKYRGFNILPRGRCAELHDRMMVGLPVHRIECDEIAGPAWHDFNQARKPHLPRSPSTA